jgi:pyruvoyl-dependent arginine decarboxylase (PvlArgDC)
VSCVIARLHSTSNGRMIFADLGISDGGTASGKHRAVADR